MTTLFDVSVDITVGTHVFIKKDSFFKGFTGIVVGIPDDRVCAVDIDQCHDPLSPLYNTGHTCHWCFWDKEWSIQYLDTDTGWFVDKEDLEVI